jgi:hypothetical protein
LNYLREQLIPDLKTRLPETYELLQSANLVVHDAVEWIVLSGSRGLKGGSGTGSDLDLSLIVNVHSGMPAARKETHFRTVISQTLEFWNSPIDLDAAIVFDRTDCGLKCFQLSMFNELSCPFMKTDCFGIYKIQMGYNGFVPEMNIQIRNVFPMLMIWKRSR